MTARKALIRPPDWAFLLAWPVVRGDLVVVLTDAFHQIHVRVDWLRDDPEGERLASGPIVVPCKCGAFSEEYKACDSFEFNSRQVLELTEPAGWFDGDEPISTLDITTLVLSQARARGSSAAAVVDGRLFYAPAPGRTH